MIDDFASDFDPGQWEKCGLKVRVEDGKILLTKELSPQEAKRLDEVIKQVLAEAKRYGHKRVNVQIEITLE